MNRTGSRVRQPRPESRPRVIITPGIACDSAHPRPAPAIVDQKTFTFHQSLPRDEPALFFLRAHGTAPARPAGRLRDDIPFGRSRGFGLPREGDGTAKFPPG